MTNILLAINIFIFACLLFLYWYRKRWMLYPETLDTLKASLMQFGFKSYELHIIGRGLGDRGLDHVIYVMSPVFWQKGLPRRIIYSQRVNGQLFKDKEWPRIYPRIIQNLVSEEAINFIDAMNGFQPERVEVSI